MPPRKRQRHVSPPPPQTAPDDKQFQCEPCEKGFTTRRALKRHQRESMKECADLAAPQEEWRCTECAKLFTRFANLERHRKEQHGDGKQPCPRCGKPVRLNAAHMAAKKIKCLPTDRQPVHDEGGHLPDFDIVKLALRTEGAMSAPQVTSDTLANVGAGMTRDSVGNGQGALGYCKPFELLGAGDWATNHPDIEGTLETIQSLLGSCVETDDASKPSWQTKHPTLHVQIPGSLQQRAMRSRGRRTAPCGFCRRNFEVYDQKALLEHLNAHLKDLSEPNSICQICKIAFVNKKDLERHLRSARSGHCGFAFKHETECTGHHPPPSDSDYHAILMDWCTDDVSGAHEATDSTRFRRYNEEWIHAQVRTFKDSFDTALGSGIPKVDCMSLPTRVSKSLPSIVTTTQSLGATLALRPGKHATDKALKWKDSAGSANVHQDQQDSFVLIDAPGAIEMPPGPQPAESKSSSFQDLFCNIEKHNLEFERTVIRSMTDCNHHTLQDCCRAQDCDVWILYDFLTNAMEDTNNESFWAGLFVIHEIFLHGDDWCRYRLLLKVAGSTNADFWRLLLDHKPKAVWTLPIAAFRRLPGGSMPALVQAPLEAPNHEASFDILNFGKVFMDETTYHALTRQPEVVAELQNIPDLGPWSLSYCRRPRNDRFPEAKYSNA